MRIIIWSNGQLNVKLTEAHHVRTFLRDEGLATQELLEKCWVAMLDVEGADSGPALKILNMAKRGDAGGEVYDDTTGEAPLLGVVLRD